MSLPNPTFIGQQATVAGKTYQVVALNPPMRKAITTVIHGARIEALENLEVTPEFWCSGGVQPWQYR